ncbi:hypothetical protein [Methylobacterium adhaesivum]|uniref:Uncharacterized protein n=2 Tax=Methylobacterium adhaesivum TaxID=333297 RepID=A0ABT8BKM6_9HYPH|nr:hypothetical protein [Methylobacterium adhaesivum]MDN3592100.1 hypothetical protein [Methylobacterium adhaesivum]
MRSELARALGLSATNGNDHVLNMENEKSRVSGTIAILVGLYLDGASPPDGLEIFRERGRRRADSETGEMPPAAAPRRRKAGDAKQPG